MFGMVVLGVAAVVLLAAATASSARSAARSRMIWRAAVVVLLLMLGGELTGVAHGIVRWAVSHCSRAIPSSDRADDLVTTMTDAVEPDTEAAWQDRMASNLDARALGSNEISETAGAAASPAGARTLGEFAGSFVHRSTWWPGIIWAGVALLLGARRVASGLVGMVYSACHALRNDVELSGRLQDLARRFGLNHVRDVVVPGITGPVAFGVVRPTVGLPPRFSQEFSAAQQEAMLAHELEHLAARDPAWYFLSDLTAAALWWHPLAWWARRQLRAASEWTADEASLVVPNGPEVLADCLVRIGGRLLKPQPCARPGIEGAGFRSDLGRRVTRLLSLADCPRGWRAGLPSIRLRFLVTVAMVVTALVSTGWSTAHTTSKGELMQFTLQQSWRRSLAAVALFSVLGNGTAPAAGLDLPIDLLVGPIDEAAAQDGDDESGDDAKRAAAIREKLERLAAHIEQLRQHGKIDEAEELSQEGRELKVILQKITSGQKARIAKEHKKEWGDAMGKKFAESIVGLRERLKQLEEENSKLRAALMGQSERGREEKEQALRELHEKLLEEKPDLPKEEILERARIHIERARNEWPKEEFYIRLKESAAIREKLEALAEHKEKLAGEAEKLEADKRKLAKVAESIAKEKLAHPEFDKSFGPHAYEMADMLKQLRAEVSSLRHEVAELRDMVKQSGDAKDLKKQAR
jgi:hypothetical protein